MLLKNDHITLQHFGSMKDPFIRHVTTSTKIWTLFHDPWSVGEYVLLIYKIKRDCKGTFKKKKQKKQTPPLWPGRSWEAASHGGTCTCSHPSPASIDKDMIDSTESQWFPVPQQDPEVREKRSADVHGTGWNEVSNK